MKKIITIITAMIFIVSISAHAQVTQERQVSSFSGIHQSTSADVYITYGADNKVTVKADEDVIDKLTTTVEKGVLYIDTKGTIRNVRGRDGEVTR